MSIDIQIKELDEQPAMKVVALKGELDILGGKEFGKIILPLIAEGNFNLISDLSQLEYINSTGIYWLMRCFSILREKGKTFKLVGIKEQIKEVLEVVGITKIIPTYTTLKEAIADRKGIK